MGDRRRVTVGLSAKLADRLEAEIGKSGLSISEIIKTALDEYLTNKEVCNG